MQPDDVPGDGDGPDATIGHGNAADESSKTKRRFFSRKSIQQSGYIDEDGRRVITKPWAPLIDDDGDCADALTALIANESSPAPQVNALRRSRPFLEPESQGHVESQGAVYEYSTLSTPVDEAINLLSASPF